MLVGVSSTSTIYQAENDLNTSGNGGSPRCTPLRPLTDKSGPIRSSNAEVDAMTSGIGDMTMAGSATAMEICNA
jgi:hypothetical protein